MNTFMLGNYLHGFYEGEFRSKEEAWIVLSARFVYHHPLSYRYPNKGRNVFMIVNGYDRIMEGCTNEKDYGNIPYEEFMSRSRRVIQFDK